jgi:uncharacterized protein
MTTEMQWMANVVKDNSSASRFELKTEKGTAFINYRRSGDLLTLIHTEVPEALSGQGIGSALVKGALDLVQERGEKIIVQCSFVARFLEKHPGYQALETKG